MPAGKHKGIFIGAYVPEETAEKLSELSRISGLNKSQVLVKLIMDKSIPNKSYDKTLKWIAKIGGLIKHEAHGSEDVFRLGSEVLRVARKLQGE